MHSRISSKMDSTRRAGALARGLAVAAALVAAAGLSGCRGQRSDDPPRQFLPDMDDQPKWKAQQQTQFFADGRTMRPPVAGTVAFGRSFDGQAADRAQFIREDEAYFYGLDGAGQPVAFIPESAIAQFRGQGDDDAAAMLKMIARGRERYNIYCAICHSYNGDGQGIVGQRWSYSLPNYHDEIFRDRSQERGRDGHMYRVARWGLPDPATPGNYRMPPYYDKVNERDAWAIVAYIRTLQASWTSDLDAVPATERERLMRSRPQPPAENGNGAGGGNGTGGGNGGGQAAGEGTVRPLAAALGTGTQHGAASIEGGLR